MLPLLCDPTDHFILRDFYLLKGIKNSQKLNIKKRLTYEHI